MPDAAGPLLRLHNLRKTFHPGTVTEVQAVRGIDLDVAKGEFITIIGGNGAGKSTLLNLIAGVFAPDAGSEIRLAGREIGRLPEYKRAAYIGRVFQDPLAGTAPNLTIEQNLAMALLRGGRRGFGPGVTERRRDLFRERLASLGLGLEKRMGAPVGLLSGGQRQALTLLMATLVTPELLLLDEHTAALDPATAQRTADLTARLVLESGLTTLMVTHNMALALAAGSRTLMLHEGRIILDIAGPERAALTVRSLVDRFFALRQDEAISDRLLLY